MVLNNRRRWLAETQMLRTRRPVHGIKGYVGSRHLRESTRRAETSVRGILGRRFPRVGSATDCGVRVVRQHGNPAHGSGKCDRTDRAVRHDRLGERRPEKPGVDDSLADGSTCDSATGRSRARDETRPADLGRDGPETCSATGRVSSCGGSPVVYDGEDVTSDTVANREVVVSNHLDPGEAQAFALADAHDGQLLTDDGDARSFAKDQGVTVVGSVGVLLAAIDAGKINEATADEWLSTWIDEIGYYVPYRTISEYR